MLVLIISSALLVALAEGGCQEDLLKDQGFIDCSLGFASYGESMATNPTIICSEEAKAAMECMFEYQKQCPEMMEGSMSQEQRTAICSGGGVPPTGPPPAGVTQVPCMAAQMCMVSASPQEAGLPAVTFDPNNSETPYVTLPYFLGLVCGPLKEATMCLDEVKDKCTQLEEILKGLTYNVSMAATKHNSLSPEYPQVKSFVKEQCTKVPAGFPSDSCVAGKLASQEYLDCADEIIANVTFGKLKCSQYKSIMDTCLKTALVTDCGQEKFDAFATFSTFFVNNYADSCDTSAAAFIRSSFFTLALLAVLSLLF